jgi:hypothetical protein
VSPAARTRERVPYKEIDTPIAPLVRAVNRFPGIHTVGSCGGHDTTTNASQAPKGHWWLTFQVDHTEEGWISLEFIAWAMRDVSRAGSNVLLQPFSLPPYLNYPGQMLLFQLALGVESPDDSPDKVADTLAMFRRNWYVTAKAAAEW